MESRENILLQSTDLSASEEIILNSLEGAISQTDSGKITANQLHAEAHAGISLKTQVQETIAKVHGTGDIIITEADAIVLTDLSAANGSIQVTARPLRRSIQWQSRR